MTKIFEVRSLSYTYPDGRQALRGVNLEVFSGEAVAIIGPNGAGKSTLLLALAGLIPVEGEVIYKGRHLNGLKDPRRLEIGILFQDPDTQLFSLTVYEDVAFGPRQMGFSEEEVHRRVKEALEKVGLSGFEERSPHHLSFGERRRVALATVLSMQPDVLLLDEPTSNLDPRARKQFLELMKGLRLTRIVATHDLELAYETADRVVVLYQGKVVACGRPSDVILNEKLLKSYGLELPLFVRYLRGEVEYARKDKASLLSTPDAL